MATLLFRSNSRIIDGLLLKSKYILYSETYFGYFLTSIICTCMYKCDGLKNRFKYVSSSYLNQSKIVPLLLNTHPHIATQVCNNCKLQ